MPSSEKLEEFIKIAIKIVATLIVLLLLAYGISTSEFNNIKKYDESDDSKRLEIPSSKEKLKFAKEKRYSTKVRVEGENMANLGDFEMNIVGNKKLVMNMSMEFKDTKKSIWPFSKGVKNEIVKKGVVLRSAVIDTLSHYNNIDVNNENMKEDLIDTMNNYLSDGEIKEVYFNEYITH